MSEGEELDEQTRRMSRALGVGVVGLVIVQFGAPILVAAGVIKGRVALPAALVAIIAIMCGIGWWISRIEGSTFRETMRRANRAAIDDSKESWRRRRRRLDPRTWRRDGRTEPRASVRDDRVT